MKFFIYLSLFLTPCMVEGQAELILKDGYKCLFKGEVYKFKELGSIMSKNHNANIHYQAALSRYKLIKGFALTGLGVGVAGAFIIGNSNDSTTETIGVRVILAGLLVEVLSIIPKLMGDRRIGKAISVYNFEEIEKHGISSEQILSFKETQSGIGLILSF